MAYLDVQVTVARPHLNKRPGISRQGQACSEIALVCVYKRGHFDNHLPSTTTQRRLRFLQGHGFGVPLF